MKRVLLIWSVLLFISNTSFAASGIFDDAIKVQKNAGTETEYYFGIRCPNTSGGCVGSNSSTTTNFQGVALGTGVTSLKITWAEVRTFKNGGSDITGATLFYRVYKTGDNPSFTSESIAFGANIGGGGDQRWTEVLSLELTTGLLSNTAYTLEIYSTAAHDGGTHFNNDSGNNFKLTFTTDIALGVDMRGFFVKKLLSGNELNWETTNDLEASHFDIERSANNQTWANIGTVKATNSAYGASYNFTDNSPLSTINYYRLAMVDRDGKVDYSKVVSVSNGTGKGLKVYPNPAKDELTVQNLGDTEGGQLTISDMTGRQVRLIQNPPQTLKINDLSSGVYFLRSMDKNGLAGEAVRFVKQ